MPARGALFPWLLRALWAALPFVAGPPLADALDAASRPVQVVASIGLWIAWTAVLVATLAPRPEGLTALRIAAPGALAATALAAAGGHASLLALAWTAATAVLALGYPAARLFASGAAYPNEQRLPLRTSALLLAGPVELAWALTLAGIATGPLLLAAKQWVTGTVALVIGLPLAARLVRSLHTLARRWVVFVPAGLVLHDPLSLADPVLFPRRTVRVLRPATTGTDGADLTQGAPGLVLELVLAEPVDVALVRPRRDPERRTVDNVLFVPGRPGELLGLARERRIPTA